MNPAPEGSRPSNYLADLDHTRMVRNGLFAGARRIRTFGPALVLPVSGPSFVVFVTLIGTSMSQTLKPLECELVHMVYNESAIS
jgi:hypothetical protein